jgi:hypothetical protein
MNSMRRFCLWLATGCLLVVGVIYLAAFLPVPVERTVYQEDSPDGSMTALYSYRPAGLLGWAQGDSSYVYLNVYRKGSNERVVHTNGFGDVPWEAVDRLNKGLPWPAKRTTGDPSKS